MSPRRAVAVVAVSLLAVVGVAACGDDSGSESSSSSAGYEKVPMADVLAGLPVMVGHGRAAASAAAQGDYTTALTEYDELHEIWEEIEGTIKDTDRDIYERIETAQGLIKDGAENDNSERVEQGADDQAAAADEFAAANA